MEPAVKGALASVVRDASELGVRVVCELLPGVGEYVLGNRRELSEALVCAVAEGVAASCGRDVCVRIAREQSPLAPTDTVLVSVSTRNESETEEVTCRAVLLPRAQPEDDGPALLAGKRVLVVAPSSLSASVQSAALGRLGAAVESVVGVADAGECLRAARSAGASFDVVYIDDDVTDATALLRAVRDDASLGSPSRVVATVLESASALWLAVGAQSAIVKPVLPLELGVALAELCGDDDARVTMRVPPCDQDPDEASERRHSGARELLAHVLASVAVAPTQRNR
jgi:CheY-like chemotaxis protein